MQVDYLIAGSGLAGSIFAYCAAEAGYTVKVVDPATATKASEVAAGIFNPVTGKRMVKSWMAEELLPHAKTFYKQLEAQLDLKVYFERDSLRLFKDETEAPLYQKRMDEFPDYHAFLGPVLSGQELPAGINNPAGGFTIKGSGWVDTSALLRGLKKWMLQKDLLVQDHINPDDCEVEANSVLWKNIRARKLVFCEGFTVDKNPYFQGIPWRHAKGEILTLEIPDLCTDYIINKGLFICPHANDTFKVGATYEWDDLDCEITAEGKEEILTRLDAFLDCDYKVINHEAAVRPIACDRAPIADLHHEHPAIGILNGFGSKGVLYAPYFSEQLIAHAEQGKEIEERATFKNHWRPDLV